MPFWCSIMKGRLKPGMEGIGMLSCVFPRRTECKRRLLNEVADYSVVLIPKGRPIATVLSLNPFRKAAQRTEQSTMGYSYVQSFTDIRRIDMFPLSRTSYREAALTTSFRFLKC